MIIILEFDFCYRQLTYKPKPLPTDVSFVGKTALITGANSGLGLEAAHELAAHGAACIYACSSSPTDDYTALVEEVNKLYPSTKVIGYPFKLADEGDTLALIDDVLNAWGRWVQCCN